MFFVNDAEKDFEEMRYHEENSGIVWVSWGLAPNICGYSYSVEDEEIYNQLHKSEIEEIEYLAINAARGYLG